MKEYISTETKSDLLKLGLYQIVGGTVGIFFLGYLIFENFEHLSINAIFFILSISALLFSFSIIAGILCLKSNEQALIYSLINQFLQLLEVAIFGFMYKYASGIYIDIGLDLTESFKLIFSFGLSRFEFVINQDPDLIKISVNFVALGIIFWISKLNRKIEIERNLFIAAQIGNELTVTP